MADDQAALAAAPVIQGFTADPAVREQSAQAIYAAMTDRRP
jgi:hypothetical protein